MFPFCNASLDASCDIFFASGLSHRLWFVMHKQVSLPQLYQQRCQEFKAPVLAWMFRHLVSESGHIRLKCPSLLESTICSPQLFKTKLVTTFKSYGCGLKSWLIPFAEFLSLISVWLFQAWMFTSSLLSVFIGLLPWHRLLEELRLGCTNKD